MLWLQRTGQRRNGHREAGAWRPCVYPPREPGRFDVHGADLFDVRVPRGLLLTESFDLTPSICDRTQKGDRGEVAETQKCKENVKASTSLKKFRLRRADPPNLIDESF